MPASINILKWLSIAVILVLAIRVIRSLLQAPSILSSSASSEVIALYALGILLKGAVILLSAFVLKWIPQQDARARWGGLILVALCVGSTASSLPITGPSATPDQAAFQAGAIFGLLIVGLPLLVLGFWLISSKAVKAYFNQEAAS